MRILFIAQAVSIHTARWINQLKDQGWDIHLFDVRGSFPHAELQGVTEYSLLFPRKISSSKPVSYGHPFFLKYGLDPFPLSLIGFFTRRFFRNRVMQLAQVIRKIKPDVIHSMEMQAESYPLLEVLGPFGGKLPNPWIVTTWGSDIYHFKQFPPHLEKIKKVLANCDYLIPDCARDEVLARELGFAGSVPMILPGAGGYPVSEMRALVKEKNVLARRLIMLKGYQGWAGRANNALLALESCADILEGYEIVVYLASPPVVDQVKSMQAEGKLNIRILPRSPHHTILELFSYARIAMGINQTDGIPNAMLEAMTMSAFPIQSNTESTTEWITNGFNGLLVNPEDPLDIARAIRSAISDNALVEKAAEINLEMISQRLDMAVIKPKVIELYNSAASKHNQ
ncbi:MAG: glycosyltransferase family 4 protein [Chloroflexi bacterium]|nr:glycosyltransferase family 4 protein [Chloroflexota bacterium]